MIFNSCSSSKEEKSTITDLNHYELVKTDSILVYDLETLQITDYNPETKRFLAYGIRGMACMEIDNEGNIIKKAELKGEGPGHFGRGMTELGYLGNDFIINGVNAYFIYDKDWNYKKRIVYHSGGAYLPVGMISGAPEALVREGEMKIIKPVNHTNFGSKKLSDDYFSKAPLIEVISGSENNNENMLGFPEGSVYQSPSTFFYNCNARVSYNSSYRQLYLSLPLDPKIYVYDVNDFSLLKILDLGLTKFKVPQGIPFEDQFKNGRVGFGPSNQLNTVYGYTNSSIFSISTHGEITIVVYSTGTEGETNITDIRTAAELAERERKVLTAFYKGNKKVFEIEERFTKPVRISETKFLAHYVNEEEELDYNKFYIFELKKLN